MNGGNDMMNDGAGWAMGLGGSLWMTLVVVAAVAIVVALGWLAVSGAAGRRSSQSADALQILKARFARGDITEQEYEQARRLLGSS
ncbi:MAG: SHOCT domain-containing protein [Chloroflexi bacterium]|nr:SHOCT domain-containing protein [Chloroflexota bacterium]